MSLSKIIFSYILICETHGGGERCLQGFGWEARKVKTTGKTYRWDDNIKMDLRKIGIDGANWIRLPQDRVQWRPFVNTVMNLRVPINSRIFFFDKLSDNQLFKYPAPWSE
jgi:hypothetical protein